MPTKSSPRTAIPSNTRSRGTKIQSNMSELQFNCSLVIVLTQMSNTVSAQMSPFLFRQVTFKSNSLWRRWWGSRLPHTWRNHPARSPHSCRPFDQVIQFFIISHWQFHIKFWGPFEIFVLVQVYWGYVFFTQEHDWHTGHQCKMISKTFNHLLLPDHYTTGQA